MNEFALAPAFWLETNARTPGLESFAIGAGRNLAKFMSRRQPHLNVVGLRRSEYHIAGTKQHRTVMQTEPLQNGLGVAHQGFMLLITSLGMRKLEQLHFLKLMLP